MSVINEKHWTEITNIESLREVNTKRLGPRHVPINHGDALDLFKNKLADRDIKITSENGMLSPDDYKYVYVVAIDTKGLTDGSYNFNLGFVNHNDKSKSLTIIAGETVMVCSNGTYTGQIASSRRRHTENAIGDIDEKFDNGFEYFDEFVKKRCMEISTLKNTDFTEEDLGKMILNFHRRSQIGNTHIHRIIQEYDKPTFDYQTGGNTFWDFHNAVTHTIKKITNPIDRMRISNDSDRYMKEIMSVLI